MATSIMVCSWKQIWWAISQLWDIYSQSYIGKTGHKKIKENYYYCQNNILAAVEWLSYYLSDAFQEFSFFKIGDIKTGDQIFLGELSKFTICEKPDLSALIKYKTRTPLKARV